MLLRTMRHCSNAKGDRLFWKCEDAIALYQKTFSAVGWAGRSSEKMVQDSP
jgi:hypothetical protein